MQDKRTNSLPDAALAYASDGFSVFPCHSARDGACSCRKQACGSPGKHPRISGWRTRATGDPEQIRRWWRRWPKANIGVITWGPRRIVVLDIDGDGAHELADLERRHGRLPKTFTVNTGSGGCHLYFTAPEGSLVGNSISRLGKGLDVRGDGGYAIAPPSIHASGGKYTIVSDSPLAPIPQWLLIATNSPPTRLVAVASPKPWSTCLPSGTVTADGRRRLNGVVRRMTAAQEGRRHGLLYWSARQCGAFVIAGLVSRDVAFEALLGAAEECGLLADSGLNNVTRTIVDGLEKAGSL